MQVVDDTRAELVDRHIPRSNLPGPLKDICWGDLSASQQALARRAADAAGIVSKKDLKTYDSLSKVAEMFLDRGRVVLIVAVVLAAVQVASLIITAALSSANRNALREDSDELPTVVPTAPTWDVAPKPAAGMVPASSGGFGYPAIGNGKVVGSSRPDQQQFIRY